MKTNYLKFSVLLSAVLFALIFTSCEKDDSTGPRSFENGMYIANEGAFTKSNASVSFFSYTDDSVYNDIFSDVNNRNPGDVVQSITVTEENTFIVVNNSNKIEVVNTKTLSSKSVIEGINEPRYMVINGTQGYVTAWGDYSVKVVDLNSMAVIKSIPVGVGPEKMLIVDDKLYVTNAGDYDMVNSVAIHDSVISVIDLSTNEALNSIVIDGYNTSDLELDKNGKLWVLAKGWTNWTTFEESPAKLIQINPKNQTIENTYNLPAMSHPAILETNQAGDQLFYGGNFTMGITKVSITDPTTPTQVVSNTAYGFDVIGQDDEIFIFEAAADYASAGKLSRFSDDGQLIKTYSTGINPNGLAR